MRRSFAPARADPPARTRYCTRAGRNGSGGDGLGVLDALGVGPQPLAPVRTHRLHDRDERAALLGERVLDARRDLGERLALHDALLFERAQAQRERPRRDAFERALELAEARAP